MNVRKLSHFFDFIFYFIRTHTDIYYHGSYYRWQHEIGVIFFWVNYESYTMMKKKVLKTFHFIFITHLYFFYYLERENLFIIPRECVQSNVKKKVFKLKIIYAIQYKGD